METNQVAGIVDQASIGLRYVKDEEIHEPLFAVKPIQDSCGKGMNELPQSKIEELGHKYEKITGEVFEGTFNMRR